MLKNLTGTNLLKLHLPLPQLAEQKNIASIVSTWDQAIQLSEKLIDYKQKKKLAFMREIYEACIGPPNSTFSGFETGDVPGCAESKCEVPTNWYVVLMGKVSFTSKLLPVESAW